MPAANTASRLRMSAAADGTNGGAAREQVDGGRALDGTRDGRAQGRADKELNAGKHESVDMRSNPGHKQDMNRRGHGAQQDQDITAIDVGNPAHT